MQREYQPPEAALEPFDKLIRAPFTGLDAYELLGEAANVELKVIVMTEKYVEIPEHKVALRGGGGAGEEGGGVEHRKQEKVEFLNETCMNSAREICAARCVPKLSS